MQDNRAARRWSASSLGGILSGDDALDRLRNRAGCLVVIEDGRLWGFLTASAGDGASETDAGFARA